jgi:hypothetical protein
MSHCSRLYSMVFNLNSPLKLSLINSCLNLDTQTGLQDSFRHMTLGYQVPRLLGPIKGTMDIVHYLQLCLQRFSEPKLTCPHLCSNILFVFYGLPFFFFRKSRFDRSWRQANDYIRVLDQSVTYLTSGRIGILSSSYRNGKAYISGV